VCSFTFFLSHLPFFCCKPFLYVYICWLEFIVDFFFFEWDWNLNSGLHACTLPLEPLHQFYRLFMPCKLHSGSREQLIQWTLVRGISPSICVQLLHCLEIYSLWILPLILFFYKTYRGDAVLLGKLFCSFFFWQYWILNSAWQALYHLNQVISPLTTCILVRCIWVKMY
jgi:hypothetical protein